MHHPNTLWGRRSAIAGATALLLAAASLGTVHAQTRSASASITVRVSVADDGAVRVSTDAVALPANVSIINWQLTTPGWRFAEGSIDFGNAADAFKCRVFSEGASITCNRSLSAPQGQLPYRIRLSNGGALVEPPQPFVYISLE